MLVFFTITPNDDMINSDSENNNNMNHFKIIAI